ncbi:MAG: hypothetical protein HAW58_04275 [Candidatus Thioglobus sp.]|nr:hypothetical protein [Candidatus Thioglobus sp.]
MRGGGASAGVEITSPPTVVVGSTLNLAATQTISATISSTATFTYTIQDSSTNIATISGNTLTGVAPGEIIIQASVSGISGGTLTGTQKFTVTPILVTSITINSADRVRVGTNLTLTSAILPANATNSAIIYSISSGGGFANLSANTLSGIADGVVTIIATAADGGGITDTQDITVFTQVVAPTALKAVATGTPNQVRISWAAVAGAEGYKLYQSTGDLSGFAGGTAANLSAANPAATPTNAPTTSFTVTLSGSAKTYFLVTSTYNTNEETNTNGAQAVATAHSFEFAPVAGAASTVWMDRNLGASQVATASDDADAYGDLYQWGRPADGHQLRTNTVTTATLAVDISPGHADFITINTAPNDWTSSGVDNNGALRAAIWSRIDGSSICPTGFRVPSITELNNERDSWTPQTQVGAFASSLKWTSAAFRNNTGARPTAASGYYWSYSTDNNNSRVLALDGSFNSIARVNGFSVRCIQN